MPGTLTDRCVPPLALATPLIVKRYASVASLTSWLARQEQVLAPEGPAVSAVAGEGTLRQAVGEPALLLAPHVQAGQTGLMPGPGR